MKKIIIVGTVVWMIFLLAACNQEETKEEKEKRVVPVETEEVKEGSIEIEKSIYGRTRPSVSSPVMLQASGKIDELKVNNGDQVEENDVIATIISQAGSQSIRAPKDGKLVQLTANEGEMVSQEEPLAIVADFHPLTVELSVTASDRKLLEEDDELPLHIEGKEWKATITSVGSVPNDTGLYPVEAEIDNEDSELLPGMTAQLIVTETTIKDAIVVPTTAVEEQGGESFVYIVKDKQAKRVDVSVEESQTEETAIEGDVKSGDQVIVKGQLSLKDGSQVKVAKGE
ncbi:efflux RND transporter periplasmic adaptor subunit [Virgibacillus chiguensis]|uniref:RND family efflux transporter, MFP subunit n=1 Tax=Virgibacillus chiguensis TaxID=411959 RepID=A0A1M5UCB3_9BACI|nr:efflux RND transporter periplasmic adaptor subunit [Virgibacillus chiguensis]SHH60548.1 RND family efflux transporter, MFP subunit [Virgibacillus chiguensis]